MKITTIWVGKTNQRYWTEAIEEYAKRLQHYATFGITEIADVKNPKNLTQEQIKQKEGESIMKALAADDFVVLLDDKGEEMTSMRFADWIDKKGIGSVKRLVFVIGGAYGFSDEIYQRANSKLSLSRMTFSHQMVRVVFLEQLYRAYTILNGEPYHHE